jgi:hypothetical protein
VTAYYPSEPIRGITGHSESIVSTDTILGMLTVKSGEAPGRYQKFVESVMKEEIENPLQKVYGGMILGSKSFIKDALARVKYDRVETPEIARGKMLRSTPDIEEIISACCRSFGITREDMICSRRGESRKTCIYLIKKHTSAKNREIAQLFGTLSYSAVAKINQSVSKQLAGDKELQERIRRLEVEYSLFNA